MVWLVFPFSWKSDQLLWRKTNKLCHVDVRLTWRTDDNCLFDNELKYFSAFIKCFKWTDKCDEWICPVADGVVLSERRKSVVMFRWHLSLSRSPCQVRWANCAPTFTFGKESWKQTINSIKISAHPNFEKCKWNRSFWNVNVLMLNTYYSASWSTKLRVLWLMAKNGFTTN